MVRPAGARGMPRPVEALPCGSGSTSSTPCRPPQGGAQIDRRRRLADPALLVRDGQDTRAGDGLQVQPGSRHAGSLAEIRDSAFRVAQATRRDRRHSPVLRGFGQFARGTPPFEEQGKWCQHAHECEAAKPSRLRQRSERTGGHDIRMPIGGSASLRWACTRTVTSQARAASREKVRPCAGRSPPESGPPARP